MRLTLARISISIKVAAAGELSLSRNSVRFEFTAAEPERLDEIGGPERSVNCDEKKAQ